MLRMHFDTLIFRKAQCQGVELLPLASDVKTMDLPPKSYTITSVCRNVTFAAMTLQVLQ